MCFKASVWGGDTVTASKAGVKDEQNTKATFSQNLRSRDVSAERKSWWSIKICFAATNLKMFSWRALDSSIQK